MSKELNAEKARLKRLAQFKDADDIIIEKAASKIIAVRDLVNNGEFLNEAEKSFATKIFTSYLNDHEFETQSDLATLSILVWDEVLISRIKKTINQSSTDDKTYVSEKSVKSLNELTNQILSLKKTLGIDKEQKVDEFTSLQLLKKRYQQHILENRAEYTLWTPYTCSGCGKQDVESHLLRIRVKEYDLLKHPFFAGRFTYNAEIIKDVQENKITVEMAARYLEVSPLYIEWCIKNLGRILPNK